MDASINAWEDIGFRKAVEATGRKKLIMTALWTEACLTFPTLDALKDGYEVYVLREAARSLLATAVTSNDAQAAFARYPLSKVFTHTALALLRRP